MPTTYTHYRFGDKCIQTLSDKYKDICQKYRDEFNFGVHGPDIFFYYDALKGSEVSKYGTWMHDQPFKDHLFMFKKNLKNHDNKDAALSYLLGFTCHFTLDSYCHGYIDHKDEEHHISHGHIEAEFDRWFLKKDGYDPVKTSVTTSLKPSKKVAHNIAQLFDRYDDDVIYKTLKDQVLYLNLLKDDSDLKRNFLSFFMDIAKVSKFKELFINKEDDPRCLSSMMRLEKYFNKAVEHYPILAKSLISYLFEDKPLDDYFHNHFCPKPDYKSIPLLDVEEELKYQVDFQK